MTSKMHFRECTLGLAVILLTLCNACNKAQPTAINPTFQNHIQPTKYVGETNVYLNQCIPFEEKIITCVDGKTTLVRIIYSGNNNLQFETLLNQGDKPLECEENAKTVKLNYFPMIANGYIARLGRWNFCFETNESNQPMVTLGNGSRFQIIYQDSRLSIGSDTDIFHYGLRCISGDTTNAENYLAEYLNDSQDAQKSVNAWLQYTPPTDVIPCLMSVNMGTGAFEFVPLLRFIKAQR